MISGDDPAQGKARPDLPNIFHYIPHHFLTLDFRSRFLTAHLVGSLDRDAVEVVRTEKREIAVNNCR